ncbi:unnamed protein product [marine sediment metagenome]|uniref:Uncharacterized protein n=1 Tax=marine sediment metagenome TaxID=412755 RepID=X1QZJ3_9ZZZZ
MFRRPQARHLGDPIFGAPREAPGPFLATDRAVRAHTGFNVDLNIAVREATDREKVPTVRSRDPVPR